RGIEKLQAIWISHVLNFASPRKKCRCTKALARRATPVYLASADRTLRRSVGKTSASNHGLRRIHPVLRQLGCGRGKRRGPDDSKFRTVSVIVAFVRSR